MLRKYIAHNCLLPIFLAWQLDPAGRNYNVCFSYHLERKTEADLVVAKLQELIQKKAYFRQTFSLENNQLIAVIHDYLPAEIRFFNSNSVDFSKLEQELLHSPHQIDVHSAIKLNVVYFEDKDNYILLFNIHHIYIDGNSLNQLMIDLNQLLSGNSIAEEDAQTYVSRVSKEESLLTGSVPAELSSYIDEINAIASNIDYSTFNKDTSILYYTQTLPDTVRQILLSFCKLHKVSIFNALLVALGVFFTKLFNRSQGLVIYPLNIRTDKSINGCFVNTMIYPLNLSENDNYLKLLTDWYHKIKIYKKAAKFRLNDIFHLQEVQNFCNSNFTQPYDPLCLNGKKLKASSYPQMANTNLSIKYREEEGKYLFSCDILEKIFPEHFASTLLDRFFIFLQKLIENSASLISKIDITFDEEKQKFLSTFNKTEASYPRDKTLIDLFDEIVKKYPNKIAVKAYNGEISYAQLNHKAEELAAYLVEKGVKADDIVGILIDNRLEMIVSIWAVLKSGAAYVSIAYNAPIKKVNYVLKNSQARFLLTLPQLVREIEMGICVLDINQNIKPAQKYIKPSLHSNNLAYVVYTSGTTGKPKGILIEHRSVVNYVSYLISDNQLDDTSIGCKFAAFGFDASVIEIYPILLSGGTLCIIKDEDQINFSKVDQFLKYHKINYAFLPTQFAELFFKLKNTTLKNLIVGGDKLTKYIQQTCRVINAYGPTEVTVQSHAFVIDKTYENIPIGKPINNVKCYVVDRDFNFLPIGLIGELVIGGEGLARGYLNCSAIENGKFIPNPFQTQAEKTEAINARLYKTGDLVRWLPDGNLEYIGRNDFQVKIRGYRIELGEIENKLLRYPGIEQTVVVVKNDANDKYLVAYYVSNKEIREFKILDYLADGFPEYMLPKFFVKVDYLPLTVSGKLDRKKLTEQKFVPKDMYVPPTLKNQELVCLAFSEILKIEKIGINDDFFKLGGNSIKAISLVANLQCDFNISITDIFNLRTPAKIAKKIPISKNNLKKKLDKFKRDYEIQNNRFVSKEMEAKLNTYLKLVSGIMINHEKRSIFNVLLTGSTGFLGCNLLHEILISTNYKVTLLIRADSDEKAFEKINHKFQYYFNQTLYDFRNRRLFVYSSDIERKNLGLSEYNFQFLANNIDSLIHSAAFTKHYGEYETFYAVNVQGTINLLEFSKQSKLKDFHYISTISVLNQGYVADYDHYYYTEDDMGHNLRERCNLYIQSKCEAENAVVEYRKYGIAANIYRVGNLSFMASNGRAQENIKDNAFFNRLNCLLRLGVTTQAINFEEISPVDLTAQAIVKLFNNKHLHNQIFHVFNPNLHNMANFFSGYEAWDFKMVSLDHFLEIIMAVLDKPEYKELIVRFLLHQGWLSESCTRSTVIQVLQDKTHAILKQLGFEWQPITREMFSRYLSMEVKNAKKISHT